MNSSKKFLFRRNFSVVSSISRFVSMSNKKRAIKSANFLNWKKCGNDRSTGNSNVARNDDRDIIYYLITYNLSPSALNQNKNVWIELKHKQGLL